MLTHTAYHIPPWLLVLLTVMTVHRLSRLITRDTILDGPRGYVTRNFIGWLVDLLTCMWCVSVWVAVPVVVMTVRGPGWWLWVMVAAAASSVTGLLGEWE